MLLQLQHLDVVKSNAHGSQKHDGEQSANYLRRYRAAKRDARNHQCPNGTDEAERDDEIPVDTVEKKKPVSNGGNKLETHQQRCRKNGKEMQFDANEVQRLGLVSVAFSGSCRVGTTALFGAEPIVKVEIYETGEAEAK